VTREAASAKGVFTPKAIERLKYYVYLYVDPRDGQPFYIGKGKGNRCFAHLGDQSETEKVERIREIRKLGLEPEIEILKHGMTETEALLVESTAIDLLDVRKLTNRVRGHGARHGSRASVNEIAARLDAEPAEIRHPSMLIVIRNEYRHDLTVHELYDATRSAWVVGERRSKARFAMAVFQGVIREVYEISAWLPSGSTMRVRDKDGRSPHNGERWEFVGNVAPEEIRDLYINKSVDHYFRRGAQNPVKYACC